MQKIRRLGDITIIINNRYVVEDNKKVIQGYTAKFVADETDAGTIEFDGTDYTYTKGTVEINGVSTPSDEGLGKLLQEIIKNSDR